MDILKEAFSLTPEDLGCLKKYDTEGTLELYHWDTDRLARGEFKMNERLARCRGVIIDTGFKKILCNTFGYTPEYTLAESVDSAALQPKTLDLASLDPEKSEPLKLRNLKNPEEILELSDEEISSLVFKTVYDGTIIRLFYYYGKWKISTHRKIDASKSVWSRDHLSLWKQASVVLDLNSLDRRYVYVFLMCHPDNHATYIPINITLVHVATLDQNQKFISLKDKTAKTKWYDNKTVGKIKCIFWANKEEIKLKNKQELEAFIKSRNRKVCETGVMAQRDGKFFKIVHPDYQVHKSLRGSCSSLQKRYLQLKSVDRENPDAQQLKKLLEILPGRFSSYFGTIETRLNKMAEYLSVLYQAKYIEKNTDPIRKPFDRICERANKEAVDKGIEIDKEWFRNMMDVQKPGSTDNLLKILRELKL